MTDDERYLVSVIEDAMDSLDNYVKGCTDGKLIRLRDGLTADGMTGLAATLVVQKWLNHGWASCSDSERRALLKVVGRF